MHLSYASQPPALGAALASVWGRVGTGHYSQPPFIFHAVMHLAKAQPPRAVGCTRTSPLAGPSMPAPLAHSQGQVEASIIISLGIFFFFFKSNFLPLPL